jgi:putative membrane protein
MTAVVEIGATFFSQPWHLYVFIALIYGVWSLLVLVSLKQYGWKKTVRFFLPMMIVGLFIESAGVALGRYQYPGYLTYISVVGGGVPLVIVAGWSVNLVLSLHLATSIVGRLRRVHGLLQIVGIAVTAGCVGVCLDMLEDPLAHQNRWWVWDQTLAGAAFFDVPLSNFRGWFVLLFLSALLFLLIERSGFSENRKLVLGISSTSVVGGTILIWQTVASL